MSVRGDTSSWFTRFASATAHYSGRPVVFAGAVGVLCVWAITGPIYHYNDTWQLVINTGTTIVTFLMVFLIQNTQNRDSEAIHIKLDELICVIEQANNALLDIEQLDEKELDELRDHFGTIAKAARIKMRQPRASGNDTDGPATIS